MNAQPLRIEANEGEITISMKLPRHGNRAIETVSRVASGLSNSRATSPAGGPLIDCPKLGIRHTANFAQVHWCGEIFSFSGTQRKIVEALVIAMVDGADWLDEETLNACAERDGGPIYKLFKNEPAWGRWIVPATSLSKRPATYRLETAG